MTRIAKPERTDEVWAKLNGLAPPSEKLTGKSKERFVRDTVDSWINERVLSVKNLGSLIDIQLMIKRQVPVVRYKLLDIKRTSRVVVEPYFNEEWTREDPPNSLFDLPFVPPPDFSKQSEDDFEALGFREVETCKKCRGKGEITCPECKGRGEYQCPSCDGSGKKKRSRKVDGKKTKYYADCPRCRAFKKVDCKECKTTGKLPCKKCDECGKLVNRTIVSSKYIPREVVDVLYRGDLPAEVLAKDDVLGQRKLTALVYDLQYLSKGKQAPGLDYWEKAAGSFRSYFEHINEAVAVEDDDKRVFRVELDLHLVPVIEVAYKYHKKKYKLFIYGKENQVHADPRPSATAAFFGLMFRKLAGIFQRRKKATDSPQTAMIEACIWMCWADGHLHERERELVFEFIRLLELPKSERTRLGKLMKKKPEAFDFKDRIKLTKDKARCLKLCWQVTLSDGVVDTSEERAISELAKQLEMSAKQLSALKKQAEAEMLAAVK
jgi:uncharacterized tellurite resistance protein B-like protein